MGPTRITRTAMLVARAVTVMLLVLSSAHAHPAALKCRTDEETRTEAADVLRVGASIMKMTIAAPDSTSNVTFVSTFSKISDTRTFTLGPLPAGAYWAIRASGEAGVFEATENVTQVTAGCPSQLVSLVGGPSIVSAVWKAPDTQSTVVMKKTGITMSLMTVGADQMQLTLTGPQGKWFGVGFGATAAQMAGYAIIIDEKGQPHERSLVAVGNPGDKDLLSSLTMISNTTKEGQLTVVVRRARKGKGPKYYSFDSAEVKAGVPVSSALGGSDSWPSIHSKTETATLLSSPAANVTFTAVWSTGPFAHPPSILLLQDPPAAPSPPQPPGKPTPTPTTPPSTPTPPPTPAAHGGTVVFSKTQVSMALTITGSDVSISFTGPQNQWFGVGFGDTAFSMKGYAIIIDEKGQPHERSLVGPGDPGDSDLSSSLKVTSHGTKGGQLTIVVSRAMKGMGGDYYSFDTAALKTGIRVSSALGGSWPSLHTETDKAYLITGGGSAPEIYDESPSYHWHGILMTIAWGILIPMGVLAARFKARVGDPRWFQVHRAVQMVGVALGIAGFVVILVSYSNQDGKKHFQLLHAKVGLAVMVMAVLQPLNAFVRPPKPHAPATFSGDEGPHDQMLNPTPPKAPKPGVARALWEILHKKVGYATMILAWFNIILAFDLPVMSTSDFEGLCTALQAIFYIFAVGYLVAGVWFSYTEMTE